MALRLGALFLVVTLLGCDARPKKNQVALEDSIIRVVPNAVEDFTTSNPFSFVIFCYPTKPCDDIEPEYAKAALLLKAQDIPLAWVNIGMADSHAIRMKYNIEQVPRAMWFEWGEPLEYSMLYEQYRTTDYLVAWMSSMAKPVVVPLDIPDPEAWETAEALASPENPYPQPMPSMPCITFFGPTMPAIFETVARSHRGFGLWYYIKHDTEPRMEVKHFDEDAVVTKAVDDAMEMTEWFRENALPIFGSTSPMQAKIHQISEAQNKKGMVWVIYPPGDEDDPEAVAVDENGEAVVLNDGHKGVLLERRIRPVIMPVAQMMKDHFIFSFMSYLDKEGQIFEGARNLLGDVEPPAIVIIREPGSPRKYVYDGEMDPEPIAEYLNDILNERAQPTYKSEEIFPEDENDGPVRKVTANTFEEEVFLDDKDVILLACSKEHPEFGERCKKLEQGYDLLGERVAEKGIADMVAVKKIDGMLNDSPVDGIKWKSKMPAIWYIQKGKRDNVRKYTGRENILQVWRWIRLTAASDMDTMHKKLIAQEDEEAEAAKFPFAQVDGKEEAPTPGPTPDADSETIPIHKEL